MGILKKLNKWVNKKKGRYVRIEIDPSYGSTCWNVILGNSECCPESNWYHEEDSDRRAEVYVDEICFWDNPEGKDGAPVAPNCVFTVNKTTADWPGLKPTIKAALKKAKELKL